MLAWAYYSWPVLRNPGTAIVPEDGLLMVYYTWSTLALARPVEGEESRKLLSRASTMIVVSSCRPVKRTVVGLESRHGSPMAAAPH